MAKKFKIRKSLIGAILFAIALWAYTNLNKEFTETIEINFEVSLPNNRALIEKPQKTYLKVKGKGWDLFNLKQFNKSRRINLDLSGTSIIDDEFEIGRTQLINSVENIGNMTPIEVIPDYIKLRTDKIGEYSLEIIPLVKIKPKEGYLLINDILVSPPKIKVRGSDSVLKNLKYITTESVFIEGISRDFKASIPLSDSLSSIFTFSQNKVNISGNIQQIAEKVFYDIDIKHINGTLADNEVIYPKKIDIKIRYGADLIDDIRLSDIIAYIDIKEIRNSPTGIVPIKFRSNKNIIFLNSDKLLVHYYQIIDNAKLVSIKE